MEILDGFSIGRPERGEGHKTARQNATKSFNENPRQIGSFGFRSFQNVFSYEASKKRTAEDGTINDEENIFKQFKLIKLHCIN